MQTQPRFSRILVALVAAGAVVAALAVGAFAAEPTREGYVAQVEPICKKNTSSLERALKGVKAKVKHGKLKPAAVQFRKAAGVFAKGIKRLRAVEQPSADAAQLNKWLKQLETGTGFLRKISKALKAGKRGLANGYILRLSHNSTVANNIVLRFEFHHCLVDSSRFS